MIPMILLLPVVLPFSSATLTYFSTLNGQILTPGLAIVDSPQPFTPEGGDFLQVALDVTGDGRFDLPPYSKGFNTGFYNITIFLSSYDTGLNLTITNGTASAENASLGNILYQEPSSTVKHVNWVWPACFVGDKSIENTSRGDYNITIQQNFRLNGTNYYTIFNLPISISNSISEKSDSTFESVRPECGVLNNPLLSDPSNASSDVISIPYLNGGGVDNFPSNGMGGQRAEATPGDGLGSSATKKTWTESSRIMWLAFCFVTSLVL